MVIDVTKIVLYTPISNLKIILLDDEDTPVHEIQDIGIASGVTKFEFDFLDTPPNEEEVSGTYYAIKI